nr:hypothetical protein [Psychrobacter sp. KH172YL61]
MRHRFLTLYHMHFLETVKTLWQDGALDTPAYPQYLSANIKYGITHHSGERLSPIVHIISSSSIESQHIG